MATPPDTAATSSKRELAAIMFSDIAAYTAMMGRDEERAMCALAEHRALLRSLLPKFNGRMLGEIGDGTLSSFHSASEAVNCAREIQAAVKHSAALQLRIGIHLGEVVFTDDNAWGDGVNIASRIHTLAPPGSICVSSAVYDEIRNKPGMAAKNLGRKNLKNVSRSIGVYILSPNPDTPLPAEAKAIIEEMNRNSLDVYVPSFNLAIVYLGMGDHERALDYLEQAYSAHSQWLGWLKMDRIFDPLREEPRFIALMKKLNFVT
jgi:class 3 adenylate cyclase